MRYLNVFAANKLASSLILIFFALQQIGCTLSANIQNLNSNNIPSDAIILKIQGNLTQVDVNEGSTLVLIIAQSAPLDKSTKIKFDIEEKGFSTSSSFNNSFPIIQDLKAGETISTLSLNTKHDLTPTGNKNFRILISSEEQKIIGTQLDLTIIDIEADLPTLSISNVSIDEGQNAVITASLSHVSDKDVSFNYTTSNGSALAGTDYTAKNGTIIIPAGATSATMTISSIMNASEICATDKTFSVQLSAIQNANNSNSTSLITIKDVNRPTISISNTSATEGSNLNFAVSLSTVCPTYDITFNWQTIAVSATSDIDYTHKPSTLASINKGSSGINLSVSSTSDSTPESSETFNVVLSNPTNASLGQDTGLGSILDDDFGDFTISGITSDNENIADAYLSDSLSPIVTWTSSTGATNYDIQIFEDDGVTSKCSVTNTSSLSINLSSCSLTLSQYYKASVTAKSGTASKAASNNLFRFYVNNNPRLHTSGSGPYFVLAGNSITVQALGGASPVIGIAEDLESHTLSLSNIGVPNLGSIASSDVGSFTLSTVTTEYGQSSIPVTITDSYGGKLTTTVKINIMKPFTWTGANSTAWGTGSNWCGSIAANSRSCLGSPAPPTASDVIYFDETCTSSFTCSPTTTDNLSAAGLRIRANGFTQGAGFTITIGSSGWSQSGGTFNGGNSTIQLNNSNIAVSGTGVFNSTTGNLSIVDGGFSFNNSFSHNNGTVSLNSGNVNLTSLSDFYNLTLGIWTASAFYLQNNLVVRNTLITSGAGSIMNYQINAYGNVQSTKTINTGTTVFNLTGDNNQTLESISNGIFPRIIIDKRSGTLTGGSSIIIMGGGIEVLPGSSVDFTNTSLNINAGGGNPIQLNNNTVKNLSLGIWTSGSMVIKDNINVSGNLTLGGNGIPTPGFAGVKISTAGNLYINFGCGCWGGKINLEMIGSTNSVLGISSTPATGTISGAAFGGNLTINKLSDSTVTLENSLNMTQPGQNLIINSGELNMAGYNVTVMGASLNSTTIVKNAGVLTVNGSTIGTGAFFGGTISP